MGVKLRKRKGKWYLFIDYNGRRKAKCVGNDKRIAEKLRSIMEAKLALGEAGVFEDKVSEPTFSEYAEDWIQTYARLECKPSTADGYEGVFRQYLRPRFGDKRLKSIRRDDVKSMIAWMVERGLSRNTVRNALCVVREIFNHALEAEIVDANPAARLGRFTRSAKTPDRKGVALTTTEVSLFLQASKEICPEYYPLFLTAVRAGLRRGELVALRFGDIQFGADETGVDRYLVVQHNYVRREHTTTKSKKARRVDLSRELRRELLKLRDERLLQAYLRGATDIADELVFPGPTGGILDPDNLYHRYFQPTLTTAGIRKIRLHDLRHTFGSLLIQAGASIVYVKEQMGHSSIQITVDTYGHLIPGANVSFIDRLDAVPQPSATQTQPASKVKEEYMPQAVDLIGGGEWTRTTDLRIMRPSL